MADMIYNELQPLKHVSVILDPLDSTHRREMAPSVAFEDLLRPMMRGGQMIVTLPTIANIQAHTLQQLKRFHAGVLRFDNPHKYPVGLEQQLYELKAQLILDARHGVQSEIKP